MTLPIGPEVVPFGGLPTNHKKELLRGLWVTRVSQLASPNNLPVAPAGNLAAASCKAVTKARGRLPRTSPKPFLLSERETKTENRTAAVATSK